jgi:hypothetical protein
MKKVFGPMEIENSFIVSPEWYYSVDTWDKYKVYLSSKESNLVVRPDVELFCRGRRKWNKIGVDDEEFPDDEEEGRE